jgi:superfamily II DNA/RNA helicase
VYFVVVCNLFVHVSMSARRDTIVQAQSGTGKTGTFSIAALQIVDANITLNKLRTQLMFVHHTIILVSEVTFYVQVNSSVRSPQVLLMSPTRELAQQTFLVLTSIGLYLPSIRSHLFIGGKQTSDDLKVSPTNLKIHSVHICITNY